MYDSGSCIFWRWIDVAAQEDETDETRSWLLRIRTKVVGWGHDAGQFAPVACLVLHYSSNLLQSGAWFAQNRAQDISRLEAKHSRKCF